MLFRSPDALLPAGSVRVAPSPASAPHAYRDYYCVLLSGTLFIYHSSRAKTPADFALLRHAAVELDARGLARGELVFTVRTPLRAWVFRAKHQVRIELTLFRNIRSHQLCIGPNHKLICCTTLIRSLFCYFFLVYSRCLGCVGRVGVRAH